MRFESSDGWRLAASYHEARPGRPTAVLIHGVASAKDEWGSFAEKLWALGIGTLALDLRGHGESVESPRGRRDFTDFDATGEWPKAGRDVAAALSFLNKRNIPSNSIALIGASIGANLASQSAPGARWLVLLSPGLDYRGVLVSEKLPGRALIAASPNDSYAYQTARRLAESNPKAVFLAAARGHGVQMFQDDKFLAALLDWISNQAGSARNHARKKFEKKSEKIP